MKLIVWEVNGEWFDNWLNSICRRQTCHQKQQHQEQLRQKQQPQKQQTQQHHQQQQYQPQAAIKALKQCLSLFQHQVTEGSTAVIDARVVFCFQLMDDCYSNLQEYDEVRRVSQLFKYFYFFFEAYRMPIIQILSLLFLSIYSMPIIHIFSLLFRRI